VSVHGDRLVVVGGSIAGLLAARVLSDHFAEVTIVERGGLPDNSGPRRGVPRSVHLHGLTLVGRLALDQIYGDDSFTAAMRDVGAVYLDFYKHPAVLLPEGWLQPSRLPDGLADRRARRRSGPTISPSGATEYRSPNGELLATNASWSFRKPGPGQRDSMTVERYEHYALEADRPETLEDWT
jgi:hypothetical protein